MKFLAIFVIGEMCKDKNLFTDSNLNIFHFKAMLSAVVIAQNCPIICPDIYLPVCAKSKSGGELKTFENACVAEADICLSHIGEFSCLLLSKSNGLFTSYSQNMKLFPMEHVHSP